MDPELAATIGALVGGAIMGGGVIVVGFWKLWKGLKAIAKTTGVTRSGLAQALGAEDLEDEPLEGARPRHHTGAFQVIVRDELRSHLSPIIRGIDEIRKTATANAEAVRDLADGQKRQGDLIVDLTRGHARVAKRTAEHSARLNIARASDTMTNGVVEP